MSELQDIASLYPEETKRILREAFELGDRTVARIPRILRSPAKTVQETIKKLGLAEEFKAKRAELENRFGDPELRSTATRRR